MTKKASALALAALAAMVFATSASAASPLPLRTAEQLAHRLALKEIRGRNIVAFHVTHPRRHGAREVDFSYDDRSRGAVFCTARIVVTLTPSTGRVFARIAGSKCRPIPAVALSVEAVTARALRAVSARRHAVNAAVARFRRSLAPCARLRVPRAERSRVRLIVGAAGIEALEHPVDAQVAAFVAQLGALSTNDATLAAAQGGWVDYLASVRVLPRVPDACAAVKKWARSGYKSSAAPVDFAILERLNARTNADGRAIARAARLLAADGVLPQEAVGFTPAGLLLQLSIKPLIATIA